MTRLRRKIDDPFPTKLLQTIWAWALPSASRNHDDRALSQCENARLTVWYVAVLAGILVLYVAAVLVFQYALLQRQMYHDEVQDMETVEGLLRFDAAGRLQIQQNYFAQPQNRLLVDRYMEVRNLS